MINIVAPPGCYGTYVARCLHHYTSRNDNILLDFDVYGSSHEFRKLSSDIKKTSLMHWQNPESRQSLDHSNTIVITGDADHFLDYYDNQFYKQEQGRLVEYLTNVAGADIIQERLKQGWGYTENFDDTTPRWLIREYCSFWQTNSWEHGYNNERYLECPNAYNFCCEDLWNTDIWDLVNKISNALEQKIYAPKELVHKNHQTFLECQKYHDIQLRCEQFVMNTINSVHEESPCMSLFDEAHVQHTLRTQGYEIRCHDLNQFPTTSSHLAELIYETSNHSN